MPQYFSPGVYVEEVDSGPRPIQGVSTSVTGAVGVTQRGPTNGQPVLVTSFNEFVRTFGAFMNEPEPALKNNWDVPNEQGGYWWRFAHSVKGFFDNGGQQLFVKRVFAKPKEDGSGANSSSATLGQGMIAEIEGDAGEGSTQLKLRHLISLAVGTGVSIRNGETHAEIKSTTISAYDAVKNQITLTNPLTTSEQVVSRRGDFVLIRTIQAANASLSFTANSFGAWGDDLHIRVRPMIGAGLTLQFHPSDATAVNTLVTAVRERALTAAYDGSATAITVSIRVATEINTRIGAAGLFRIIGEPASGGNSRSVTFRYTAVDTSTGEITLTAAPADSSFKAGSIIRPVDDESNWSVEVEVADAGLSSTDTVQVQGRRYTLTAGSGTTFDITPPPLGGVRWVPNKTALNKLRDASSSGSDQVNVRGADRLYPKALVELDNGTTKEFLTVSSIDEDTVTLSGNVTQSYLEGDFIRLIEAEVGVRYIRDGAVEVEETFTNLHVTNGDDASSAENRVTQLSQLVEVDNPAGDVTTLAAFPIATNGGWQKLANGDDAVNDLSVDDFVGEDGGSGNRTGIQALEDVDDISIVVVPGMWSSVIQSAAITHCEMMRYRVAILDSPPRQSIQEVRAFRSPLDSKYAALYYPWLRVRDPILASDVEVASSGHVAGIYTRVDGERGVHKAPANEVIRSITGINQDVTRREQDLLNPEGINAHRFFPGRGFRVWGARTISSDSNFRYVNVRRIFNFIERSIDEGTQFVVFEPNNPELWSRVRQTVSNFLNTQWREGVLEGRVAEEAYFVACDRGVTMTQAEIEDGKLICEVGIAPVFPAEFVIFRIQKFTADSKLA